MVAFSRIKAGDVLYDVRRSKGLARVAGSKWDTWNGNPVRTYYVRDVERWRRARPDEAKGGAPRGGE